MKKNNTIQYSTKRKHLRHFLWHLRFLRVAKVPDIVQIKRDFLIFPAITVTDDVQEFDKLQFSKTLKCHMYGFNHKQESH